MKESILRTIIPILYAILVNKGVVEWLGVSDEIAQGALTLLVTGVIYVAIRFAETHQAALGWLLGYPSQPKYGEVPPNPPEEPYATPENAVDEGRAP